MKRRLDGKLRDSLKIADKELASRLLLGSAAYPDLTTLAEAIKAAEPGMVTVAVRRAQLKGGAFSELLKELGAEVLPNTAGCFSAADAVLTAQLARRALATDFIKLEVLGDEETLLPDAEQLLKATKTLAPMGFKVMAYCNDDPILCRKLERAGAAAVMPLAAPIGSGLGVLNPHSLEMIKRSSGLPVIVDAGLATASQAARVMELGLDGVLVNTAVAKAKNPPLMAKAFSEAVTAGRSCYLGGRIPERRLQAIATSPQSGKISPLRVGAFVSGTKP